jgi:C4-dicarboxylate transporter/malic acid transport protein
MEMKERGPRTDLDSPPSQGRVTKHQHRLINRLQHFTWGWYTLPMSTGGLALLLSSQPHTFPGLHTIGKIVYLFDLVVFALVTVAITFRFIRFPGTLKNSLNHPTESLFFATSLLSLASIISCIARYGIPDSGPWLIETYRVLFWIYFAISFSTGVAQYFLLFTEPRLRIQDMTPAWDLPMFPFMLSGTIASAGIQYQPPTQAMSMLVAGLLAQGVGFIVSVLMFAAYIRRMIQYGLPSPSARPGMFISVGPPSFTILVLIGLAKNYPKEVDYFGSNDLTRQVLMIMSTFTGIFLWGLSFWFFAISLISVLFCAKQLGFHLNWWAFIFPNVGFTIATIDIGEMLQSEGIQWVGSVMSVVLVAMYLFVGANHIRAVASKQILWPGKDEDVHVDQRLLKREKQELYRRQSADTGSMLSRTEEEHVEAMEDMRHME